MKVFYFPLNLSYFVVCLIVKFSKLLFIRTLQGKYVEAPRFGGSRDGDGKGEKGGDDMTSDAEDEIEDHVERQPNRAADEGYSSPSIDLKVGDPPGVAETTSIGPMENQCTVLNVEFDVKTAF